MIISFLLDFMQENKDKKKTKVLEHIAQVHMARIIFTPVLNLDWSVVIWC